VPGNLKGLQIFTMNNIIKLKAVMVSNVTGNVIVIEIKGNIKHCKYAVTYHNPG
jgi:hypothetical protein